MSTIAPTDAMQITPLGEHLGAEVTGLDLRNPLDPDVISRLYDAAVDHVALVIRNQRFSAAQYAKAAALFGDLMEDQNRLYLAPGVPLVSTLSNRHKDSQGRPAKVGANATWHTDHTNQPCPPKFTCLYAVELPDSGGATSVCNMRAAYAALEPELRTRLSDMQTANSLISSARFEGGNPDIVRAQKNSSEPFTIHPLVRTHPDRGTQAIWFHKSKTEKILGMTPAQTQDFLEELLERALRPEFIYVHEWRRGDMLIVDNRSAMHKASHDFDHSQHRLLYRALVRGDRPV
ncbi:MAG: TauD/TfdA family dioxygenase [Gammaproteobacteria bacterium]|nr:TauD/TfdA family dioxygenase [Gammaproteobacteria bacterium]